MVLVKFHQIISGEKFSTYRRTGLFSGNNAGDIERLRIPLRGGDDSRIVLEWREMFECVVRLRYEPNKFLSTYQEFPAVSKPIFLYVNDTASPTNFLEGFPRNELLVRTFRGLSGVNGARSVPTTKKRNAELSDMKDDAIPSLAYVATHADGEPGHFKYYQFYRFILGLFGHAQMETQRNELFLWWKRQMFPHSTGILTEYVMNTVHFKILSQLKDDIASLPANVTIASAFPMLTTCLFVLMGRPIWLW
ncbi:hypothetical protein BU17DRAFT_65757 [Hysterangium stoloniferum]|nr:hypothetical protein BU17DRAFT_65757 [Hysterangium stoloniferum]